MFRIGNAFSLGMCLDVLSSLAFRELSLAEAKALAEQGFVSCVGHEQASADYTALLGVAVVFRRESITLNRGDKLLVGQPVTGRLAEGATHLEGQRSYRWILVEVA